MTKAQAVGGTPRRRIEGTFAVSSAALMVASLSLLLAAEDIHGHGVRLAEPSFVAVVLALFVIVTVALVDLRLSAGRRRAQQREKRLHAALVRLEGVHGFARTLGAALGEVQDLLRARDATLATCELETGNGLLWTRPPGRSRGTRAAAAGLDSVTRAEFLFATAADAWVARRRAEDRWDVLALGAQGLPLPDPELVPTAALERLSRRLVTDRLAGLAIGGGGEWEGRVIVVEPGLGPRPEESLRLAQRLVREMGAVVQSRFLLGRLRARVGALERARIARDLHDGTIQSLVAIEMELEILRRKAAARGSPTAAELARVKALLHQEILDLRDTMQRLKPAEIEPGQLVGFLDAAVARFERESGIHAHFDCGAEDVDLTPRVCRELARVVQEALQNVRKHSQARSVVVRLARAPLGWRLVVDDDGEGFAAFSGTLSHAQLDESKKGPYVLKERVRALGGELTIATSAGGGSRLDILLPDEAR
jgi:signal transduction histidine kinase